MGKVANDPPFPSRELPATPQSARHSARTGTLSYGLPVSAVLEVSTLSGARVLAGATGLGRIVQRLNVMEVPDILPWVKPHELLLTTGYPLRDTPHALAQLVCDLDERGLAALGIKLHRYLDRLPDEMLAQADALGFPIVELPDGVGFDDILNQVLTDILNRQAAMLERSEEVHRALLQIVLEGGELAEVADGLVHLLGGAVLITATDGRILAASGGSEDLAALRSSSCMDEHGRLRVVDEHPHHRAGAAPPALIGHLAVVPVVAGAPLPSSLAGCGGTTGRGRDTPRDRSGEPVRDPVRDHGRIVAYSPSRTLDETDVHILENAATVAALVITKQLAVTAVESKYQADFLRDVLDGRVSQPERVLAHSGSLGWDFDRPLVVVVAALDPGAAFPRGERDRRVAQDRFVASWAAAVHARDPRAAVVGFAEEVVAVVGAVGAANTRTPVRAIGTSSDAVAPRTAPRAEGHPGPRCDMTPDWVREAAGSVLPTGGRTCSTGISRVTVGPAGLPAAYEQARRAMGIGRRTHGVGSMVEFDDLGVFRLLSLIPDSGELRAFVRETLGELAAEGPETADLRNTLRVLLETNVNVAEAARRLHFHYNTLRYRIAKLHRMVGPFTTDPTLRLNLHLALHVEQMRGL